MTEITHILKYRAYWRYMGFCPTIANWQWEEESYYGHDNLPESLIVMEELTIGLTGGFIDE